MCNLGVCQEDKTASTTLFCLFLGTREGDHMYDLLASIEEKWSYGCHGRSNNVKNIYILVD